MSTGKPARRDVRKRLRPKQTGIRLDPDLVRDAKIDAIRESLFLREWIERAMRRYLMLPRDQR